MTHCAPADAPAPAPPPQVLELRGPPRPGGAARAALAGRQRDRALPLEEVSDHSFVQTATATDLANRPQLPQAGDTVHVLLTSGGGAYQNFQTRVAYATFLMAQKQAGGERMVAFTRILHRMEDDALMGEVPTFRATPLQPECDGWCDYPVSDRPNAVRQFMDAARDDPAIILAPWLYVTEADYVWVKPLAPPRAEDPKALAQGFPFAYIGARLWFSIGAATNTQSGEALGPAHGLCCARRMLPAPPPHAPPGRNNPARSRTPPC
jgi:hypothetical protein